MLARLQQIKELFRNKEWSRCGIPIVWREDGTSDPDDGWYEIANVDYADEFLFSGYGEPKIDVLLRGILKDTIGVNVDAKAVPNDGNLAGTTLAAFPMGVVNPYPVPTWTFTGANGAIQVVENPTATLRAVLAGSVTGVVTQGRCKLADENASGSTSTEVFWRDHRNINGYYRVSNDLVRYTIQENAGASPLIEVWDPFAAAWSSLGNYQLRTTNTGPVLPLQTVIFTVISPEEIIWSERRFDTAGAALVVLNNRLRRGSKLIESQIVAASGAGLTDTQSVAIVNAANASWTASMAGDSSGAAFSAIQLTTGFEEAAVQPTLYGSTILQSNDFETAASTADLFHSIGTEALGTLAAWPTQSGTPSIASNVVTLKGTGDQIVGGHADWGDLTWTDRFQLTDATTNSAFYVHYVDGNNWIRAEVTTTTITLRKNVAGILSTVGAGAAPTLTAATWYWYTWVASGTTYTFTLFADTGPGTKGAAVTNGSATGTIADAAIQNGQIGAQGNGGATHNTLIGGAFANVCYVTGPVPTGVTHSAIGNWATQKEAAFCWSQKQAYYGSASLSITEAVLSNTVDVQWILPGVAISGTQQWNVWSKVTGSATAKLVDVNVAQVGGLSTSASWATLGGAYTRTGTGQMGLTYAATSSGPGTVYFDYATILQPNVPTGILFDSLGAASWGWTPTGDGSAWSGIAGLTGGSFASHKLTLTGNIGNSAGHADWWDGTAWVRWDSLTPGSNSDLYLHCDGTLNNLIAAQIVGVGFFTLAKTVGGSYTSVASTAITAPPLSCWCSLKASGTTYTATLYKDAGGYVGDQMAQVSGTIADAAVQSGKAGLRQEVGGQTAVAGGNFPGTFLVQGPLPTGASVTPVTGEPAFCWSQIAPYAGTYSMSIYIPPGLTWDGYASESVTLVNGASYTMAGQVKTSSVTGTGARLDLGDGVSDYFSAALTGTAAWTSESVTHAAAGVSGTAKFRLTGAGTAYFDAIRVGRSLLVPGFAYLTYPPTASAATVSGQVLASGLTVPAGTVTRLAILAGYADDQYLALLTTAAYAQRWAAYSRTRVRQRLLIS